MPDRSIIQWLVEHAHLETDFLEELWETHPSELYEVYEIRAHRGHRRRLIEEPTPDLKRVQQALIPLYSRFPLHPACMARKGRSYVDNANAHDGARHVLKVDIRKCYPSTTSGHLHSAFLKAGSELKPELHQLWLSGLHFCLIPTKRKPDYPSVLPTGAPTSPVLCNIALTELDCEVSSIVAGHGYEYTRFMDDLTISTKNKKRLWSLLNNIDHAVQRHHYEINKRKTRWLMTGAANEEVIVTGVRVGRGSKVPREFRRMLRAKLQNLAKDGKPLDPETIGCLAYVKSIDRERYDQFMSYYERRRQYEPHPRISPGPEQILSSNPGNHS